MPGKVKVKIISGRNLPVMDRSSDTTDAYVEIKLGNTTYKTDVCRKSLHPMWNSDWYRFELDDSELQDEPLQIRLMDHDTYSANDAIGKVYLDLNPLLLPQTSLLLKWNEDSETHETPSNSVMSGWIPVYDTMHGIRGEVNIVVKVELFSDFNKFRQSSCGVQIFCSPIIPHGYFAQVVHGFVEELLVYEDPEYQWIDKIRTPRASNEARQTLFFKLSGELQRKIGLKALDLGGNSIIGYLQSFDLEGESGIVARGIGTAVTLIKMNDTPTQLIVDNTVIEERTQNYLNFLGAAEGFNLKNNLSSFNKIPRPLPKPSPTPSIKSLKIEVPILSHPNSHISRHLSDREFNTILRPPTEMIHHCTSLQTLLKQEELRGTPGYGLSQKIKNLKYSSQSMLSKRMTQLKAKLSDSNVPEKSDIKGKPTFKYRRTQSDSTGMAEILVKSVFYATASLEGIAETPTSIKKQPSFNEDETNTLLSVPDISIDNRSSNASSSSSDSSSIDDDDDYTSETKIELDTVSHIVETVRKQSMIIPGTVNLDDKIKIEDFNLLHSIALNPESDEELNNSDTIQNDDNSNVDTISVLSNMSETKPFSSELTRNQSCEGLYTTSRNNSLNPQPILKKNSTTLSLTDLENIGLNLSSKFSSLHNIHNSCCKMNKYSTHEGKETVLGHLFKQLDTSPKNNSNHNEHKLLDKLKANTDKIIHVPKALLHKVDVKLHHKNDDNRLLETALGNVLMESVNDILATSHTDKRNSSINESIIQNRVAPESPKSLDGHLKEQKAPKLLRFYSDNSKSDKSSNIFKFPKVLFQRLDSKIHKKSETVKSNGLLNAALENVLMDSVNEVLATSHSNVEKPDPSPNESRAHNCEEFISLATKHNEEGLNEDNCKVGFFKDSKNKICKASKSLFQRLNSKIHKNEGKDLESAHGLLNTALGNVLMDSVNEILVTSHSKSGNPSSNNKMSNLKNASTDFPVVAANLEIDVGNRYSINTMHACLTPLRNEETPLKNVEAPVPETRLEPPGHQRTESAGTRVSHSPAKMNPIPCINRRSSDSDLSVTPKGNSLTGSDRSGGYPSGHFMKGSIVRSTLPSENFDILEYPFLTMSKYPPGFIAFIGGVVSARSVKLLQRVTNSETPESRDTWWSEIRMEIRSHARALNCNAVLGYVEDTSISDDVCVLSASGTAAVIGHQYTGELGDNVSGLPVIPRAPYNKEMMTTSLDRNDFEKEKPTKVENNASSKPVLPSTPERDTTLRQACSICHLPYVANSGPLRKSSSKCLICRNGKVPDVLIATIEIPDGIPSIGRGCIVQSYVFRNVQVTKGESNAKGISDGLPFLEYELHRLLINKLKVKGMNAVFGLKVRISIGERMLFGIATGTAVYLTPLASPPLPKLVCDRTTDEKKLMQLKKTLHETVKKNREIYQLNTDEAPPPVTKTLSESDDSEEEQTSFDYSVGNKECSVLEVDDQEDVDVLNSIMESRPPDGFHVVNTEIVPGLEDLEIVKNLQMFIQMWRGKIQSPYPLDKQVERLLQSAYFKFRQLIPCAICDLQFRVDIPENDEVQLCILGMALGLGDPPKSRNKRKTILQRRNDDELIFNLEEDQIPEHAVVSPGPSYLHAQNIKHRQKSPIRSKLNSRQRHVPYRERHGVDITPLSYVAGAKIEKYLGNLNFFLIRETTSIREEGGLSGFMHSFVTEILAIVRAHVTALGGNAMVAYFLTECVLNHNLHKNQGQCLINVGGDVVHVSYYPEDH